MVRATRIITCVGLFTLAASLPLSEHDERQSDIYEPWINEPNMSTTWTGRQDYYVRWNTDGASPRIGGIIDTTLWLSLEPHSAIQLAVNFSLYDGQALVRAPELDGKYRLLLRGGYWDVESQNFTIIKP